MIYVLLYCAFILTIFFGFAFWNSKQKDKNRIIDVGAAWTIASFWPVLLPIALIIYIGNKFEKIFDNISEKGLKDDENK